MKQFLKVAHSRNPYKDAKLPLGKVVWLKFKVRSQDIEGGTTKLKPLCSIGDDDEFGNWYQVDTTDIYIDIVNRKG